MPRARYRITTSDFRHAVFYLNSRLQRLAIELANCDSPADARVEFEEATSGRKTQESIERLNAWCEKHLDQREWTKLKSAIRKRRQRWERYDDLKTITISARAHELVSQIAERDNVTLSEVLEHYLAKAAYAVRGRAKPVVR